METSVSLFTHSLDVLTDAATRASEHAAGSRELHDADLLSAQRAIADVKRHVDACAAILAGETVRRSSVEAGLDGLARKQGFRTPEALVQGITGSTSREASTLVRVGSMLNDADTASHGEPRWLAVVGRAVATGFLSIAAADAIRHGLGTPGPGVSVHDLREAAEHLVATVKPEASTTVDADQVLRMARDARDELDAAGIIERERQRRTLRSFRRWRSPEGMTRYIWILDPEGAALVDDVYDKITSPRRGGPRFVSEKARAVAEAIERDDRTTEQLASDAFLELLQRALETDPAAIVGVHQPAVRVLVAAKDLERGQGRGWIEGQDLPVSIATVERYACRGGIEEIIFDDRRQPVDLRRTQRYFSRTQRRMLAARDGGCRWPGCERPPEWTEAHHIRWWDRDNGPTDIDNGILLCRHHHLLLHDNGWEIELTVRGETEYWLIPPPSIDSARSRRPMPSKSRCLNDAHRDETVTARELVSA